jgi:hypothetical protein
MAESLAKLGCSRFLPTAFRPFHLIVCATEQPVVATAPGRLQFAGWTKATHEAGPDAVYPAMVPVFEDILQSVMLKSE